MTNETEAVRAVERYEVTGLMGISTQKKADDGCYVLYTDHAAALQAARDEVERLRYEAGMKEETISKSAERTAFALSRAEAAERRVAELEAMLQGCRNVLDLLRKVVRANKVSRFDCVEGRDGSLVNVARTIAEIDALAPAKKVD